MSMQDTSPMNSTLPSLDGGYDPRVSDAHTEVSDGPPDPPSMNGAGIYELLHASLPTVKEEEHPGSNSDTLGGGTSSLRASFSQLHMGASSSQVQGAVTPAEMQEHRLSPADAQAERDANQLSPQAPVESKFSAFGASYMTTSPAQSVTLAPVPSSAVCRDTTPVATDSQQESAGHSVGPLPSMSGPPTGFFLTGMSSMGPVSSMLSGPVSTTTAGPVSSTTVGAFPLLLLMSHDHAQSIDTYRYCSQPLAVRGCRVVCRAYT